MLHHPHSWRKLNPRTLLPGISRWKLQSMLPVQAHPGMGLSEAWGRLLVPPYEASWSSSVLLAGSKYSTLQLRAGEGYFGSQYLWGQSMVRSRQQEHGRRAWQGKVTQPMATKKQGERRKARRQKGTFQATPIVIRLQPEPTS